MIVRVKQPAEELRLTVPVALPIRLDGVSIAARPGSATGFAVVPTIVSGPAGGVALLVTGGADGVRYLVTLRVGTADGETVEREVEVAVVDGGWAMPDGGVAYLTIAAFVESIGFEEVLAQTDDGTGRIDRGLVIRALVAAQAEVDAHLGERYALPIPQPVPPLVQTALIDRACARLYPRGAPDGITEASKAALKMLERIQSGNLRLGVPAAQVPPAAEVTDAPVVFVAGRRAYPDGLADY